MTTIRPKTRYYSQMSTLESRGQGAPGQGSGRQVSSRRQLPRVREAKGPGPVGVFFKVSQFYSMSVFYFRFVSCLDSKT